MRIPESQCRPFATEERRPYAPERSRASFDPHVPQESEAPMIDILNETSCCRQLRTLVCYIGGLDGL